jgi:hypothetical protein
MAVRSCVFALTLFAVGTSAMSVSGDEQRCEVNGKCASEDFGDGVSHFQKLDSVASLTPIKAHFGVECSTFDRKTCKEHSGLCNYEGNKIGCTTLPQCSTFDRKTCKEHSQGCKYEGNKTGCTTLPQCSTFDRKTCKENSQRCKYEGNEIGCTTQDNDGCTPTIAKKGLGKKCFNRENFKGIKTLEECNKKVRENCKFHDRLTWDFEDKACACSKDKDGCDEGKLRDKGKSSSVYTTCH